MCVILHALKKRHVTKDEILQAMKVNNAGFFGMALKPDGSRRSIRTLSEDDFVKFFDETDSEDEFVMHARIPSRGLKTLDNVHGWEEDGVVFCHNMTLTELDEVMKDEKWDGTDSEYFFRKVFMPFYRALGDDAYKDGRLAEPLDRLVRIAIQRCNKFLFVMPDGRVLRYGSWVCEQDRKENGEIAFWASNSSYKVYKRAWGAQSFTAHEDDYGRDDYESWWKWNHPDKDEKPADTPKKLVYDGVALMEIMGLAYLARTGLKAFVLSQAAVMRQLAEEDNFLLGDDRGDGVMGRFEDLTDKVTNHVFGTADGKEDYSLVTAADPTQTELPDDVKPATPEHIGVYVDVWAAELERFLETRRGKYTDLMVHLGEGVVTGLAEDFEDRLDAALMMLNCSVDVDASSIDDAVTMFIPTSSRKNRFVMAKAKTVDLVVPDDTTAEEALETVTALLKTTQEYMAAEETAVENAHKGECPERS